MNTNELKKLIYKDNPAAILIYVRKGRVLYRARIGEEGTNVTFDIPVEEMGDAQFDNYMDAKLLLRWLVEPEITMKKNANGRTEIFEGDEPIGAQG